MRFSVVIPTMRREQILAETLASLESCDPPPDEVIVVDSDDAGSSQPVVTAFDQAFSRAVRYHQTPPSLTRQRNLGIDDSSGDVVVFLDDDVSVPARLFAQLAGGLRRRERGRSDRQGRSSPMITAASVLSLRSVAFFSAGAGRAPSPGTAIPATSGMLERPRDVEFMKGCFMSARRDAADDGSLRRAPGRVRARRGRGLLVPPLPARTDPLRTGDRRPAPEARLRLARSPAPRPARRRQPCVPLPEELPRNGARRGRSSPSSWGCSWPTGSRTGSGEGLRASWKGLGTPGAPGRRGYPRRDKARRKGAQS